jgi:hypothetical protein
LGFTTRGVVIIISIDPGASGGIAMLFSSGKLIVEPMPDTDRDIMDFILSSKLNYCDDKGYPIRAVIEKVGGYIGKPMPGGAMFNFGRGVGFLHGVLMMIGARIENPTPQAWQKCLSLGTSKGMTKNEWKNKLKQKAQQLFPEVAVTLKTADALLIMEASRRTSF